MTVVRTTASSPLISASTSSRVYLWVRVRVRVRIRVRVRARVQRLHVLTHVPMG